MIRWILILTVALQLTQVDAVKIEVVKSSTVPPPSTEVEAVTVPSTTAVNLNATTSTQLPSTTPATQTTPTSSNTSTTVKPTEVATTTTTTEASKPETNETVSSIGNPFLEFINRRAENKVANYYCHCDYSVNVCEINCCCDLDCSKETIKYFDCAAGEKVNQIEYDQFGTLQDCKISGGLLCVAKSNVKETIKTYYNTAKEEKVRKNRWPKVFDSPEIDEKRNDFYELGEEVMIFNERTEMLEALSLPRSFEGTGCIFNEPVTWLEAVAHSCWRDADNATSYLVDFYNKFNSSKVLVYPVTPSMEYHCSTSSCANITLSPLNTTEDLTMSNHKIEINIWHNYTHISGMNVSFIDTGVELNQNGYVEQLVQINWKAVEERGFDSYKVSGNPGYLKEKPVLAAKEVTFSNYTEENKIYVLDFFYFHNKTEPYKANRTLLLPRARKGRCSIEPSSLTTFGVDVNRRCNAVLDPGQNLTTTSNFTSVCEIYQRQILQLLIPNILDEEGNVSNRIFISQLGNPRNDSRSWTNLDVKMETAMIAGMWQSDSRSFICSNMVISARFEFFYAKLRQTGANGVQSTIKKAMLYVEPQLDLQFKLDELAVPIFVQTQFYDVTGGTAARLLISSAIKFFWLLSVTALFS